VKICQFNQNNAKARGGAVAVRGNEVNPENDRAPVELKFNRFNRNLAGEEGCDVHVNVAGGNSGEYQAEILFNTFDGPCTNARVTHYQGRTLLNFNTLKVENDHAALRTALPQVDFQGTVLQRINIPQQQVS
jgi:predicted outer membrane repeat protein